MSHGPCTVPNHLSFLFYPIMLREPGMALIPSPPLALVQEWLRILGRTGCQGR